MTETRLDAKSLERMMLHDAVKWQESYADSVRGTEYDAVAMGLLSQYRRLYERRYGKDSLESPLDSGTIVSQ